MQRRTVFLRCGRIYEVCDELVIGDLVFWFNVLQRCCCCVSACYSRRCLLFFSSPSVLISSISCISAISLAVYLPPDPARLFNLPNHKHDRPTSSNSSSNRISNHSNGMVRSRTPTATWPSP